MADISNVEQGLCDRLTTIVYPNGTNQASIIGNVCRIYRGWPNSSTLNNDLNNNIVNITVVSDSDTGRTTTRYLPEWNIAPATPGITANTTANGIIVGGTPAVGDVIGTLINGEPYLYRIQAGDTPELVAAALGAQISVDHFTVVNGSQMTIYNAYSIVARAVCDGTGSVEFRRQEKDCRVIFWCSDPTVRDTLAGSIDAPFSQLSFLALEDGSQARICYKNTCIYDQTQNALLYRRDLVYTIEYATISQVKLAAMLFGNAAVNGLTNFG